MAPADVPEMPSITEPGLLQQPIQHAPGEGAMRAAALKRQIDRQGRAIAGRGGRGRGFRHGASSHEIGL
jgi:hypothetical protein